MKILDSANPSQESNLNESPEVTEIIGSPASPAMIQLLTEMQGLFKPADSIKRVDDFAKWVFASIAVVGTLGTGLTTITIGTLPGPGKFILAIAIFLVGLSLLSATFAIEPQWVDVNLSDYDSMMMAFENNLSKRRLPIRVAAICFASALIVAATVPFSSAIFIKAEKQNISLDYELKRENKFLLQLNAVSMTPHSPIELRVANKTNHEIELSSFRKTADSKGNVSGSLEISLPSASVVTNLKITVNWTDAPGIDGPYTHTKTLELMVPTAKPITPKSKKAKTHDLVPQNVILLIPEKVVF